MTSIPLTRRDMLVASGALGTGLALDKSGAAAAPLDLAHPSDMHAAIELAVANLAHDGVDDVFSHPVEVDLLAGSEALRKRVAQAVARRLSLPFDRRAFTPAEYIAMPNGPSSFRRLAHLEPLDAAVYTALAVQAAPAIERHRSPAAAGRVLSYRFAPSGAELFAPGCSYRAFVTKTRDVAAGNEGRVLIAFDLQQFYANISLTGLDAALARCGVDAGCRDYLGALLRYWGEGRERGLPIGANASRILAEAALIAVDDDLAARGFDFWRYVDDYRLIVDDPGQAHAALAWVSDRLAQHGFYLNREKTHVTPIDAATAAQARAAPARVEPAAFVVDPALPAGRDLTLVRGYGPPPIIAAQQSVGLCFAPLNQRELRAVNLPVLHAMIFETRIPPTGTRLRPYVLGALAPASIRKSDAYVKTFPALIERAFYASSAVMNALVQYRGNLSASLRKSLADSFARELLKPTVTEGVKLAIIGLLKSEGYQQPAAIQSFLQKYSYNRRMHASALRQKAFDGMAACGAPGHHSWLRQQYFDGDVPIKRRAALLLRRASIRPDAALRARLAHDAAEDPFLAEIASGFA